MTKKDYIVVANGLAEGFFSQYDIIGGNLECIANTFAEIAANVAFLLAENNPNFDEVRFLRYLIKDNRVSRTFAVKYLEQAIAIISRRR